MNLIEESFQTKEEKKTKSTMRIILASIIVVFLMIIGIVAYLLYVQSTVLKLTLDGKVNDKLKQILVFEDDGTIYVPIKESASYFGYESFDGEYNGISEENSKCYIKSKNEIANFSLGSNKIYKLDISDDSNDKYEYVYTKKPIKAINGVLYAPTEAIEKAFNLSFQYNQDTNRITVLTMPYLIGIYEQKILDYGYPKLSDVFVNNKTVLQNMLIVEKDDKIFGVIDVEGNIILEPKYESITYLPNTGDFLVESNEKFGIISSKKETKVQIMYNSIELMDSDAGLYLVKNDNNKYGVIDSKGNTKIYIENDEIGIDASKFKENDIKSTYLLADGLIPVRKDKYWALYDKYGKQVVDFKYDSFGYTLSTSSRDAYNLLVIPNYNVIVACKDKKYTLINAEGKELFAPIADDIFMTISGGQKHYWIMANDNQRDAEKFLEQSGVKVKNNSTTTKEQSQDDKDTNTSKNESTNNSGNSNESQDTNTNVEEDQTEEQEETEESE